MSDNTQPSGAERMFGDFAPALVSFTDDVLFGEVWKRTELSANERSLGWPKAMAAMAVAKRVFRHETD
jgi:4-carboxymuconolactone decarboxylase